MSVESGDGIRRAIQHPWGPDNWYHDRDHGFGTVKMPDKGAIRGQRRYGRPSSETDVNKEGGPTRRGIVYKYIRAHPGTHDSSIRSGTPGG